MPKQDYRKLLRRTLVAVGLSIALVSVCYFWIDRPVAFFVDHHEINKFRLFRWLTYPPPELQTWSPLMLTVLIVRRAWGPFAHWQKVLLVACLSLIVADQFRASLGMFVVVIGRRPGSITTHRSLVAVRTISIRFRAATLVVFRLATLPGSWASEWCG